MELDKAGKLAETDLEHVAGGVSENRYDLQRCGSTKQVAYECVGLLRMVWCDHYRIEGIKDNEVYHYTCTMGCYNYHGKRNGDPV